MRRERIKIDFLIHDLKVPLSVIEAGILSLLNRPEKYGPLTEQQQNVLARALRNTKITQTLVRDALELGKSREGIINRNRFRLSDLIEQALVEVFDLSHYKTADEIRCCDSLESLKRTLEKDGISLLVNEELWEEEVSLDSAKVIQILRNLLNNALKYRKSEVELGVDKGNARLVLSVKDDGEGIPVRYHQKIFECYFQMDENQPHVVRGHGLGLAGVMVLVEDMGGKLSLESDEGRGAKFIVQLPLETQ